jgi:hypothetical protein
MAFVVRAEDRELFRRCLRAWDFGAQARANYEPVDRSAQAGVEHALREALRVYYFPGMWGWTRDIVRGLATKKLLESLVDLGGESDAAALREHAGQLLERYFEWAPPRDAFSSIRTQTIFEVSVPDPDDAGLDLVTPGAEPVRYRGQIDLLVLDEGGEHWIIEHRIHQGSSAASSDLERDDRATTHCAAWETFFLGMTIAGSIYNEIDLDPSAAQPFRRVTIRRSRTALQAAHRRLALEARAMIRAAWSSNPLPASFTRENCARCGYRRPCIAQSEHRDVASIFESGYRRRPADRVHEGVAGRGWGPGLSAR